MSRYLCSLSLDIQMSRYLCSLSLDIQMSRYLCSLSLDIQMSRYLHSGRARYPDWERWVVVDFSSVQGHHCSWVSASIIFSIGYCKSCCPISDSSCPLRIARLNCSDSRSEERRVGKECRSRWSP